MVKKTEQARVLELIAKREGVTVQQLMLREHRKVLLVGVPERYWRWGAARNAQGNKVRFCYGALGYFKGWLAWKETVVRERGPRRKFSRTLFSLRDTSQLAQKLCVRRRNAWDKKMRYLELDRRIRAKHGNEA